MPTTQLYYVPVLPQPPDDSGTAVDTLRDRYFNGTISRPKYANGSIPLTSKFFDMTPCTSITLTHQFITVHYT